MSLPTFLSTINTVNSSYSHSLFISKFKGGSLELDFIGIETENKELRYKIKLDVSKFIMTFDKHSPYFKKSRKGEVYASKLNLQVMITFVMSSRLSKTSDLEDAAGLLAPFAGSAGKCPLPLLTSSS